MKKDWTYKKLGEVCEIQYGTRVVQSRDGGSIYPVYGGGGPTFKMDTYNREDCLVVARFAMSKQCTRYVKGKFFLNDSGLTLEPKDKESLLQSYLDKCILGLNDDIYFVAKGMAQKNLDMKSFKELPIKYPTSTSEQQQIVAELDLLSDVIEKQKTQIEELDKLSQSIFYDMFGDIISNSKNYEIKKMEDVFSIIKDGTHQTPQYTEEGNGFKFLSAKDVVNGFITWDNIKYIPEELHNELYKRIAPQRNDLLLCKNGTTGIAAVVETDEIFDIYVSLALLRPKENYDSHYLLYAINNPYTKVQFDESLKGIGVPNLHLGDIKKTKILCPPLSLQQEFAAKIEAIEAMKAKVRQSLKESETLFNSRMDYYFS